MQNLLRSVRFTVAVAAALRRFAMQTMTNRTSSTSVKPRPSSGRMSSGSAKGSGFGAGAGGGDGYDYGSTYAAFVDCYVERFLEESLQTALQSRGECIFAAT
jgi:hypothetical protein